MQAYFPFRSLWALPRPLWILFLATFVNRMGGMAVVLLPLYLVKEHALTPGQAGSVMGAYGVGALIAGPTSGYLSDRFGALKVMRGLMVCSASVMLIFPYVFRLPGFLAAAFCLATFEEAVRTAAMSAVSALAPPENRKFSFAAYRLFINLGMSVGPALGGFIAEHSFSAVFFVNATATLGAASLLWFGFPQGLVEPLPAAPSEKPPRSLLAEMLSHRKLLLCCLAMIPVLMAFFQHESTVSLVIVKDLHLTEFHYGMLFTLNTVLIILFELPINHATQHWSSRKNLALGATLIALGFAALIALQSYPTILVGMVFWTFGEMLLFPSAAAHVDEIAPPGLKGRYMGAFGSSMSVAFALGPWAGLRIYQSWGSHGIWIGAFVFSMVSAVTFLAFRPKTELD